MLRKQVDRIIDMMSQTFYGYHTCTLSLLNYINKSAYPG